MKRIKLIAFLMAIVCTAFTSEAKIKNARKETYSVSGNCGMCKKTIENSINKKNKVQGVWDADTKKLTVTYDANKTNKNDLLKKIAEVGYDNEEFLTTESAYNKLPGCCQYERKQMGKTVATETKEKEIPVLQTTTPVINTSSTQSQISDLLALYFQIKDALVKDNKALAIAKAKEFFNAMDKVDTKRMNEEERVFYTDASAKLSKDAEILSNANSIAEMRKTLNSFSMNMLAVIKQFKANSEPIYYDHCPMYDNGKGANWLSKEQGIKNPYYGSAMLTCGSVEETIKK